MFHKVIQVYPQSDFTVYVYFDDGKIKHFNCSHLLNKGIFKQISQVKEFIEKCTVINGTLAWDIGGRLNPYKCIDIDPDSIYENATEVADPLSEVA
jgi:hypothetical protein